MTNGLRVRQARELHGWTQTDLARDLGISQASLAQIEAGAFQPSTRLLEAIALKTGFPDAFFALETPEDFPLGSLVFRAKATVTNRQRMEAYRYAQLIYELAARVSSRVTTIPAKLPRLNASPDMAAKLTRAALGLSPDTPISRLVHTLEKNGVWVARLPVTLEGVSAV